MAKGRQPPKAPPKKTTQGYRTREDWEARSREISQRARQRDLYITTALAAGLGGLAIYEARRTIRERAVAQAQALAQAQVQAQQRADNRRGRASSNLEVIPHGALPAVATQENQEL